MEDFVKFYRGNTTVGDEYYPNVKFGDICIDIKHKKIYQVYTQCGSGIKVCDGWEDEFDKNTSSKSIMRQYLMMQYFNENLKEIGWSYEKEGVSSYRYKILTLEEIQEIKNTKNILQKKIELDELIKLHKQKCSDDIKAIRLLYLEKVSLAQEEYESQIADIHSQYGNSISNDGVYLYSSTIKEIENDIKESVDSEYINTLE